MFENVEPIGGKKVDSVPQPSLSGHLNLKLAEARYRLVCRGSFLPRLLMRDQPRTGRGNSGLRIRRAEGDRATFSRRLGFASLGLVSWRELRFQQNSGSGRQLRHLGRTAGREIVAYHDSTEHNTANQANDAIPPMTRGRRLPLLAAYPSFPPCGHVLRRATTRTWLKLATRCRSQRPR